MKSGPQSWAKSGRRAAALQRGVAGFQLVTLNMNKLLYYFGRFVGEECPHAVIQQFRNNTGLTQANSRRSFPFSCGGFRETV